MLERYKEWVRRNAGLLSLFETGASTVCCTALAMGMQLHYVGPRGPYAREPLASHLHAFRSTRAAAIRPVAQCPFGAGLSSLTWVLPERFAEGELSIEALHTALGLLSGFHDSIVSVPPGTPAPPGADLALALYSLEQVQASWSWQLYATLLSDLCYCCRGPTALSGFAWAHRQHCRLPCGPRLHGCRPAAICRGVVVDGECQPA